MKSIRSFQIGDIVILKALSWPIARVAKVYHGEDGLVHVVDLRYKEKIYKRPIHKLALLVATDIEEQHLHTHYTHL